MNRGGVINTGSRLIRSVSRRSLADHQSAAANDIRQMIQDNRLRLMQQRGPGALYGGVKMAMATPS